MSGSRPPDDTTAPDATGTRPLVSVVTIAYNVAPFIRAAIDSALMQRVDFDFEVVIGEDCSTDGTREIVREYATEHPHRVRALLNERNLGMNRNFVATLQQARGEFVALLDGDDYWTTVDKLQRQVDFLRSHPQCSICFHNVSVVYEHGDREPHPFHLRNPDRPITHHVPKPVSTIADLAGGNFLQTCSVMFRAGLYGELPSWFLEMPTFDWPLHLLNASHGQIGYIDEIMGAYRVHAAGFWSMNMALYRTIEDVESMIRGYRLVDAYTGGRFHDRIARQLHPLYLRAAALLIGQGQRGRATRYAARALANWRNSDSQDRRRALVTLAQAIGPRRLGRR